MDKKIRVGLVGIGGMGGCHFQNYSTIKGAELVAVCDVRVDMAKEKVGDQNINVYGSLEKMLKNEELDMIDICTPSYLHKEMTLKLLDKYHVLCEKPMTLTAKDANKIAEVAAASKKNFMVAHVVRFMTPYEILKKEIESKELGKLLRLDMKRISGIPRWSWNNWMMDEKLSGGVVTDLSIHDLDFVQSVLGMPDKIDAYRYVKEENDTILTNMLYGEALVTCEGTWYNYGVPFQAEYMAVFQNGCVKLDNGVVYINGEEYKKEKAVVEDVDLGINVGNDDGYYKEMQYFVDCIIAGKQPGRVTPESSARSVLLAEVIKKKAKVISKK
ncbi:MAG: Gfo/Idh/MocA family oxidoreductase [Clostridia bacterium]|nr:Gfo/Idh/MocA family oxidoreductase [Clostridia bacterium]